MRRIVTILALVFLTGCGKEIGRVPFSSPGIGAATMTLKAGDVDFWTDIDIAYDGSSVLTYEVTLEQGGASVATTSCNPLGPLHVKTMWAETNLGSSHTRKGLGKMSCSVSIPSGGATTVKATLAWGAMPTAPTLTKADLVVKQ